MGITREIGAFVGVDETTLSAGIADGGILTGAEKDILGDDVSSGEAFIYLVYSFGVATAAGSIDLKFNPIRASGTTYTKKGFEISVTPNNLTGPQSLALGRRPVSRYMNVEVQNNGTGQSMQVSVLYELYKYS